MTRNKIVLSTGGKSIPLAEMRVIGERYFGPLGVFAYDAYDFINRTYYNGDLPVPLIQVGLLPYGGCMGLTQPRQGESPVVALHTSSFKLKGTGKKKEDDGRGLRFAFDVMLHELVHVANHYLTGVTDGDSSHNNSAWIGEIARISPMIGLEGVNPGLTKVKRIKTDEGDKVTSKCARVASGNISLDSISRWPHSLYIAQDASYYLQSRHNLPFDLTVGKQDVIDAIGRL